MALGFSKNKSVQILIALLKKHGITKVIASPGTTDLEFVAGLQFDGSFEMYSSVDERSAAYMACGLANETGEPVVITCTEATASRDYYPGISEAHYRKLPILAITGVHRYNKIGHLYSQIIDRSISPKDTFNMKVQLPVIKDHEDVWETELLVNKAILELKRSGGGPVHIDLPCCDSDYDFSQTSLPEVRKISRFSLLDDFPDLSVYKKIVIYSGYNIRFTEYETNVIDRFCALHNSVVFCDQVSGYYGKFAVHANLLSIQGMKYDIFDDIDLVIHIGEPAADESTRSRLCSAKEVWRVSPDGEIRDTFKKLVNVFEMKALHFFEKYNTVDGKEDNSYLKQCLELVTRVNSNIPELPFSNVYMAHRISKSLPSGAKVHLGLSNTIRAWAMFELKDSVETVSNVGCRGIDGILSAFIGASLNDKDRLYYCVLGDLSFFYDLNALGNREIGNNVRILLINNNGGSIFKQSHAPGHVHFGDEITNQYIAAKGHFGNSSKTLVKHFAEDLGFKYISVNDKDEFEMSLSIFLNPEIREPIIVEAFTESDLEREAFDMMTQIETVEEGKIKKIAKQMLGEHGKNLVKSIIGKQN